MNRLEVCGYAGLYKALKQKYINTHYQQTLLVFHATVNSCASLYSPRVNLSSRVLSRSHICLSSRLFGCLKCLLLLIFRHILEIMNDHPSLVVKVAKSFCKNTKYCRAKSKFRYLLSVEFVINQLTINFKSGQSVLAIHNSRPYC